MVTIKRRLWGIAPYTTAFFPTEFALDEIVARLGPFDMARLFYTPVCREPGRSIIAREASTTVCVDLTQSLDALWKALHRKCRQKIGHVERMLGRVSVERNASQTRRDFLAVFNSFAHVKDHVSPIDTRILDRHAPHADIFVIYFDGRPMCAHSVLRDEESAHARLLFLGSRRLEDPEAATLCSDLNRFLHWHEIRAYREENFRIFDFGGVRDDPNDGIARFKRSFGGTLINENSYLCAGSPWIGRIAENIRRKLRSNSPPSATLEPVSEVRDDYRATS